MNKEISAVGPTVNNSALSQTAFLSQHFGHGWFVLFYLILHLGITLIQNFNRCMSWISFPYNNKRLLLEEMCFHCIICAFSNNLFRLGYIPTTASMFIILKDTCHPVQRCGLMMVLVVLDEQIRDPSKWSGKSELHIQYIEQHFFKIRNSVQCMVLQH